MKKKPKAHFTCEYIINPQHRISVNLIGLGGTGSQVLDALARIDAALYKLGHPGLSVTCYDADTVSESNIGRQMFSPADIGLNKAVCLATRVNRFYGLDWEAVPEYYNLHSTPANITVSCVDTVKSRLLINDSLKSNYSANYLTNPYYWLDFGNSAKSGQVILGTPKKIAQPKKSTYNVVSKLPTIMELYDLTQIDENESGPSCSLAEALKKQDLFINSTLAQLGSAILWSLFREGILNYHGIFLNLKTMRTNPLLLK